MISDDDVNLSIKEFLEVKKPEVEAAIESYIPRVATKE